ncbi:MAG TPA: Ppx/GppA phosphatase family protein [Oscillospiraceae bacterium]|nr:Ppx/GppA phosphatase family protein [Oscillospiraceae bacterium]
MLIAAIDIGTNSVRMLLAATAAAQLTVVERTLTTTRLGAGLQNSGYLSEAGREATLTAVKTNVQKARAQGADKIFILATSAMREASDGAAFARLLAQETACRVEIISPAQEAEYSYTGVVKSLPELEQVLVFDLGGGSCEFIWHSQQQLHTVSYKIGALYLTDRYLQHDPPQKKEIETAQAVIHENLHSLAPASKSLVGVGGTVTALTSLVLKLADYDAKSMHGFCLTQEMVQAQLSKMLALPASERQKLVGMPSARAGILPAGALVIAELLTVMKQPSLIVSEGDLLLGCLYQAISSTLI